MLKLVIGDKKKSTEKGVMGLKKNPFGKIATLLKRNLSKKMGIMALLLVGGSCFFYGWVMGNCLSEQRTAKYYDAIRYLESANMKLEHKLRRMEELFGYSKRYRIDVGLAELINRVATEEGVKPELFFNLIQVESEFKQFAVSNAGAMGYTQLMWKTAKELDPALENKAELFIPKVNLKLGARKLRKLLDMWQGNVELALLSYNRGENRVIEVAARGQNPDNGYPRMVTQ